MGKQKQEIYAEYSQNIEAQRIEDFKNLPSTRELEVLELIRQELSNKEIAGKLYIS